jgi:phenylacetic acid degradation protein paaN
MNRCRSRRTFAEEGTPMPDSPIATRSTGRDEHLEALVATHRTTLESALAAIRTRGYWSAFPESPSTKIWGEAAPAAGKAAFESLLGKDFPLDTPGADGTVAPERPPYGITLDVRYPHLRTDGIDTLLASARAGMPAWRDAGPLHRAGVCLEILHRLNARSFELAHAVMHTTGQSFVMAFQAGGANALDRALEAVAHAYDAMIAVPDSATWEKPGRRGPQRIENSYTIVPRGIALVIGCTTFPTWNGYPGFFASLVTGNPVVVKPHPHAILPWAIAVSVARDVLRDNGFDPNLVTLAVEDDGEQLAAALAVRPEIRIVDFTGSSAFGDWLEANAHHAVVYTEKSGVNAVVVDSTSDLAGMAANIAYSISLYSGQMCTAPQVIFVPDGGVEADGAHCGVDDLIAALRAALDRLLGEPSMAAAVLGAIVDDRVESRLDAVAGSAGVEIPSRTVASGDFPGARIRTPLVVRVGADDVERYGQECFGPVSFVVTTRDTAHSLELWRSLTARRGAITASLYSTDDQVIDRAREIALDVGVSLALNFTQDVYVNQTSAFADFHATGANPAANATLTDAAFVAGRFRVVQLRRPA